MSDKCDSLATLAELTTRLEKQLTEKGYVNYECTRHIIEELVHEIQTRKSESINELKKDLGVYHN